VTTTTTAAGTRSGNTYSTSLGGSPGTNPSVTATTGTQAMVIATGFLQPSANAECFMSFAVDGPGGADQSATDARAVIREHGSSSGTGGIQASTTTVVTGLTAGSNTFTLQYKGDNTNTCTFSNRTITVIPLG
jgi:hypothetical protein